MLNYALAFIAFFSWLSQLGLEQIIVRELTKCPERANSVIGTSFFMKLAGAILSVILVVLIVTNFNTIDDKTKYVVMTSSIIFVFQAFDVIAFFYQA